MVKKVYIFVSKTLNMQVELLRIKRGKELQELRKSKGITQATMAGVSGISLPTIIRMEKGKKNWRVESELAFIHVLSQMPDTHYMNEEGKWRPIKAKKVNA